VVRSPQSPPSPPSPLEQVTWEGRPHIKPE
jgi:hypothetical protein